MAKEAHVKILKKGVEAWNQWRGENHEVEVDLFGADLRRAALRWAKLSGADLSEADLGETNLVGANLRGANLMEADLGEANLVGADLSGAMVTREQVSYAIIDDKTKLPFDMGEAEKKEKKKQ